MLRQMVARVSRLTMVIGAILLTSNDLDATEVAALVNEQCLKVLERHEIPPTRDGIQSFLDRLDPDHESWSMQREQLKELVAELGSPSYQARERAYTKIKTLQSVTSGDLREAIQSSDAEVAWRAQSLRDLLQSTERPRYDTLEGISEAVGDAIFLLELKGLSDAVLKALPRFEDRKTLDSLNRALAKTVLPHDVDTLRSELENESTTVRIAALLAIGELLEKHAVGDFVAMSRDTDDEVAILAAEWMATRGYRESLQPLISLLTSTQVEIRHRSVSMLRGLTGSEFGFIAYTEADKRTASVAAWTEWFNEHGESSKLHHPLKVIALEQGLTIITQYGKNLVLELDSASNEVWRKEINTPWGCQGLPNGHRVISSYQGKYLVEFDKEGNEVWRIDDLPGNAMGLHRLSNGNTLVACSASNWIMEYELDGDVAWKARVVGRPVDVFRLDNGNTLVALENQSDGQRIVEVDRVGKVVWEVKDVDTPLAIQRLDNGNTLVGSSGKKSAYEFDRDGNMVWEKDYGNKVTGVFRTSRGDLIISTVGNVAFFDATGKEIWRIDGLKYCYGMTHY